MASLLQVNRFLCDDNYLALTEECREQRLLFITNLSETRVSAFLGWLFRPYEGHGLGDLALRELLHNAWKQVHSGDWDGLSPEQLGMNDWHPSKLSTKSFRDLCVETEYRFGKKSKARPVDIIIVSRQHKLVVLIENKFGSKVHSGQLQAYREQAAQHFPGFRVFHVYLDPNTENAPDDDEHWINLGYSWLIELIASRQSSGLLSQSALSALSQVRDYLQREGADRDETKREERIAVLVEEHADVLNEMKRLKELGAHGRLVAGPPDVRGECEALLIEYHQRHVLWDEVFMLMAHASLTNALKRLLPPEAEVKRFPKRLAIRSTHWKALRAPFVAEDSAWALRLAAWKPDPTKNAYNVRSVLDFAPATAQDGTMVPMFTAEQEASMRKFATEMRLMKKKASNDDKWIRLMQRGGLAPKHAAEALRAEFDRLSVALTAHQRSIVETH